LPLRTLLTRVLQPFQKVAESVSVPPTPVAPISPGEMQLLLSRAGLVLNPGQIADLVLAWRQVAGLIATISRDRPLADDMALAFRLPAPAGTTVAAPAPSRPQPSAKRKAATKRPAPKAKSKKGAAAKRPAAKTARKKVRRRR
jgi:hypothetical protein